MRQLRRIAPIVVVLLQMMRPEVTDWLRGAEAGRLLAQAADPQWADALRPGAGVTTPRLIKEVKPKYTVEAMDAKVQGTALLECVIETDGTVRRVRVARSLDRRFGLDQAAIEAVKEWQFEPGTKDGQPVPVLVTVELSFVLRDPPSDTAPLTLPEGFGASARGERSDDSAWEDVTVQAAPLTVGFRHPKGWLVLLGMPGVAFFVRAPDMTLGAFMVNPAPTTAQFVEPGTTAELRKGGAIVASDFNRQLAAAGQARIADRMWVWFDLGVADVPNVDTPGAASGRSHIWIFSAVVEGQQVIVAFTIGHPDGPGPTDWEAETQRAGPTFMKILERMSFKQKTN